MATAPPWYGRDPGSGSADSVALEAIVRALGGPSATGAAPEPSGAPLAHPQHRLAVGDEHALDREARAAGAGPSPSSGDVMPLGRYREPRLRGRAEARRRPAPRIRSPGTSARCSESQKIVSPASRMGNDSMPAGSELLAREVVAAVRSASGRGCGGETLIVVRIATGRRGGRERARPDRRSRRIVVRRKQGVDRGPLRRARRRERSRPRAASRPGCSSERASRAPLGVRHGPAPKPGRISSQASVMAGPSER